MSKNIYTLRNNQQLEIQARFISSKERWRNKNQNVMLKQIKNMKVGGGGQITRKLDPLFTARNVNNIDDSEAKSERCK